MSSFTVCRVLGLSYDAKPNICSAVNTSILYSHWYTSSSSHPPTRGGAGWGGRIGTVRVPLPPQRHLPWGFWQNVYLGHMRIRMVGRVGSAYAPGCPYTSFPFSALTSVSYWMCSWAYYGCSHDADPYLRLGRIRLWIRIYFLFLLVA